mgnify:CR=1 FL=1
MNVILTDVDGVLLNWQGAFDAWMMREHGLFATGNERAYQQGTRYEMTEPEIKKYIRGFNASANIGFLPPLFDAVKGVKKLHDEYGYKFLVITSLSLNPFAQKLRTQNLEAIFGAHVFEEFVYLDTGADKRDTLECYAHLYPNAYWIEDKVANAVDGRDMGLRSLLMKHIHIKEEDACGIPILPNWNAMCTEITDPLFY